MNENSIALDPRVCERRPDGTILIRVKAVPGASRDQIVGVLGDRLKVKVAAPPEGGAANVAIRWLIARDLALREAQVAIVTGPASSHKILLVKDA